MAGVEIILLHEHRFLDRVTTGRDGFFEHPVIPGGDYLVGGMSADGGHIRWTALEVPRDKSSVELDLQLEEPASLTFGLGVGLGADDQVGEDSFLILYPWPFDYGHSREAEIEKMSTVLHRVPLSSAAALRIDDIAPGEYSAILELPRAREASSGSHYHRISKIFLESGNHKTITTPIDRGIDLPVVEARAIQPDGEPWANLRLWIDQAGWPWSNAKIEALTDGDGRFTFPLNRDRLLERSGRINIQGANGASGGVTYVGQVGLQDILLVPSIRISGQVRDAAGEPVVGAKVQAMDRQARSGQEGRFEIFAVVRSDADQEADELFLDVDPIGRDGLDGQGALMHVRRERLPFVARDDLSFDIKLADAAVVEAEGRIVDGLDRPVPGAKVWIYAGTPSEAQWNPIHWEDGPWYGSSNNKAPLIATSTSDAGGHWESRFGKWNESDYRVHWGVVPPYPMDEYFVVAMGSSGAVAYAEGIESVPSLEVGDLVLSQPPSAQHVTGQLLDTEGRPLAGARIEAPSYSRAPIWTETDEDGKFALYSRSRELRVVMGKEMTFPMIEESNGEWIAESISDNQVHIEWSNGGPVKAIRWFKEPISGTPYDVLYFRRAVERAGTETLISKDGVFQFPKTLPAEPIIIYSLEGVYTTVDATALSRPESQLVLEYPAEELSCRVIGLNGDPLAGLSVAAMSDVGNFFRVLTTDEGGKCQWRVPPGRYRVSILGEGTGRYDETDSHEVILNVIPGEANEVLFEPALPPRGTLDLIFSRPDGSPITGQISLSEHQMEVPFVPERKVALDQRGSVRLEVPAGRQYVQMEGLPGLGENEVRRVRLEIGPGKAKQERIVIGTSPPINGRIVRNGEAFN
ncbi:MAG: carboxypeptidase-like regulatory domain-containing protein [Verrucomicrobiota bacterium]